jgi:hypothetical protein
MYYAWVLCSSSPKNIEVQIEARTTTDVRKLLRNHHKGASTCQLVYRGPPCCFAFGLRNSFSFSSLSISTDNQLSIGSLQLYRAFFLHRLGFLGSLCIYTKSSESPHSFISRQSELNPHIHYILILPPDSYTANQ